MTERIEQAMRPGPSPVAPLSSRSEAGPTFRDVLHVAASHVADGDRALERIVSRGTHGPTLDSEALLRLQADVYRTTQEMDLAGRLVDRMTQAVKTTLQSQS